MAAPGNDYIRLDYYTSNQNTSRSTWVKLADYEAAMGKVRAQLSVINIRTELHKLVGVTFDAESDEWLFELLTMGACGITDGGLEWEDLEKARVALNVSAISATP